MTIHGPTECVECKKLGAPTEGMTGICIKCAGIFCFGHLTSHYEKCDGPFSREKKEDILPDCGCEGSCPVCRIGEVDDHKCNRCGAKFCPKCHGIINNVRSENVLACKCKTH